MVTRHSIVIFPSKMRFLSIVCVGAISFASVFGLPTSSPEPTAVVPRTLPNFSTDAHRVNINLVPASSVDVPSPEFRTKIDSVEKNCYGNVLLTYQTVSSCPFGDEGWLTSRLVMHGADVMLVNNVSQGTGFTMNKESVYEIGIGGSQLYVYEDGQVILASNDLCPPINSDVKVNRKGLHCQPKKVIPTLMNIVDNPVGATFRRFETHMALYTCFFFFLLGVCSAIFCFPLLSKCTHPPQTQPRRPCVLRRSPSSGYVPLYRDDSQISAARHFFMAPEDMYSVEAVFNDEYNPPTRLTTQVAAAKSISGVVRATKDKFDPPNMGESTITLGPHIETLDSPTKKPIYHLVEVDLNNNVISNSKSDSGISYDIIDEERDEDTISLRTCIENEI